MTSHLSSPPIFGVVTHARNPHLANNVFTRLKLVEIEAARQEKGENAWHAKIILSSYYH